MEIVRLEEICELITDGTHQTPTYSKEGYIFLSSKNVTSRKIDWQNIKYISEELHRELIKRVIPKKNDILLAKNGTTGVGAIVDKEIEFDIYVSLALLRPNDKVLPRYLFWAINSPAAKRKFDASLKGIGVKNLHLSAIKKIEINIYNKETQEKIIKVLDKLQKILEERQKLLENLDLLSKCLFIKMFGDLNFKHKTWERKKFSELCQINPTKNEIKELEDNIEVSFIPMSAVSVDGIINLAEKVKLKKVKTGFTYFKENDVLFAKITPCMENGKGGIAKNLKNEIGFGSTEFHVLRPLKNISTSYWLYYVTMLPQFRKSAENMMTGSGGQKRVPSSYFETLKINIPPIELQNQFAERIKIIEKSKFSLLKFSKAQDLRIFKVEL